MKIDIDFQQQMIAMDNECEIGPEASSEAVDTFSGPQVILVTGAEISPEPITWLWKGWLAIGKFHLLAGDAGLGKTTIALSLAATITCGGKWPDGTDCEPGNVLIWSSEDGVSDTLLPRLIAAGAKRERCIFINGVARYGIHDSFDPASDMKHIVDGLIKFGGVKLILVDPVVSAVLGDSHKNTEVRRGLQPLVDLAVRCDAAVLGITHFSKGGTGNEPASRVIGSVAFSAVARLVMVVAKVKNIEGESQRVLVRAKSNIGSDDGGFKYEIQESEMPDGIFATSVAWLSPLEGTARDLLRDDTRQSSDRVGAVSLAKSCLLAILADGPKRSSDVKDECESYGVSWASARRASEELKITKKRGSDGGYKWSLSDQTRHSPQVAQVAQFFEREQVAQVEQEAPEYLAN